MTRLTMILIVLAATFWSASALAQANDADREQLDRLLGGLADPEGANVPRLTNDIARIWARSGSDTADLMLERGRDAIDGGNLIVAVEHFTALINHTPEFAEAWNARATAYFLMGEFGLSVADISQTLALNPQHFGALAGLGMIYEEIGQPGQAYAAFRAAQALNPHMENVNRAVTRLTLSSIGRPI